MKFMLSALAFFSALSALATSTLDCPRACDRPENCRKEYTIGNKKIDFYSNYPLSVANSCIESVIFVVHGTERNAETRYDAMLDAAKSVGQERRVLVISPRFKSNEDLVYSNDLYWSSYGWKQGNTSVNSGSQISSFAVADMMLDTVIDSGNFPFIMRASVTGHSAGGQFTQMYALTTMSPGAHPEVDFQFLVLNPSNYTYLNTYRPHPYIDGYFEQPVYQSGSSLKMKPIFRNVAGNCPYDFNDYKYGYEERNNYASRLSTSALTAQYLARDVYYFLGALDNDPNHDALDTSCEARLQGEHRLDRGEKYFDFLNTFYAGHDHAIGVVPGVGHDARGMYDDDQIKFVLFGP